MVELPEHVAVVIGLEGNLELGQVGQNYFLLPLGCLELLSVVAYFFLGAVKVVLVVAGVLGLVVEVLRTAALLELVKFLGRFDVGLCRAPSFLALQLDRRFLASRKVGHD